MTKLTFTTRYLLVSFLTITVMAAAACWILSPTEWRTPLLHLLSRSLTAFTGTEPSRWLVSNVYSYVFLLFVTLALMGIVHGTPAMKRHWFESSSITLLSLVSLFLFFDGSLYVRAITKTIYEDHRSVTAEIARLTAEKLSLEHQLTSEKSKSQNAESQATVLRPLQQESAQQLREEAHQLAGNILDFQGERLANVPIVVIGGPADLSRKSIEDSNLYNQQAVVDFLKLFGGPTESIMRRTKIYGVDTSRLQKHIVALNNIQMIRLIADDLNDVVGQLDPDPAIARRAAQNVRCPFYYPSCPSF